MSKITITAAQLKAAKATPSKTQYRVELRSSKKTPGAVLAYVGETVIGKYPNEKEATTRVFKKFPKAIISSKGLKAAALAKPAEKTVTPTTTKKAAPAATPVASTPINWGKAAAKHIGTLKGEQIKQAHEFMDARLNAGKKLGDVRLVVKKQLGLDKGAIKAKKEPSIPEAVLPTLKTKAQRAEAIKSLTRARAARATAFEAMLLALDHLGTSGWKPGKVQAPTAVATPEKKVVAEKKERKPKAEKLGIPEGVTIDPAHKDWRPGTAESDNGKHKIVDKFERTALKLDFGGNKGSAVLYLNGDTMLTGCKSKTLKADQRTAVARLLYAMTSEPKGTVMGVFESLMKLANDKCTGIKSFITKLAARVAKAPISQQDKKFLDGLEKGEPVMQSIVW